MAIDYKKKIKKSEAEKMNYKDKVAIVTGAAAGIGKATALKLAQCGATVIITDIDEKKLIDSREDISKYSDKVHCYKCDVSNESQVHKVAEDVIEKYGKIDILINNAGIYKIGNEPFETSSSQNWKDKINVNILGTMYFTQAVINNMMQNHYGRIVNIGSVAGEYGIKYFVDYSMTKGAVASFTKALAKYVGEYNITVNTVSPGNIHPIEESEQYANMSFLNRAGTPDECANVICFLASDEASFVSGQNYLVDGCRKVM